MCNNCKFYDYDNSTGASDCTQPDITEEELEIYYMEDQEGCPYKEECEYD